MTKDKCFRCGYNTKKTKRAFRNRRLLSSSQFAQYRAELDSRKIEFSDDDVVCNRCKSAMYQVSSVAPLINIASHTKPTTSAQGTVNLSNISQAGKTKAKCVVCNVVYKSGSTCTIPMNARLDLLISFRLYTDANSVICKRHLINNNIKPDTEIVQTSRKLTAELSLSEASDLIGKLMEIISNSRNSPNLDFTDPSLSDSDFMTWMGLTKSQFDTMIEHLLDMRSSTNRDKVTALAMFWVKMKTGLSHRQLCTLFNLNPELKISCLANTIHSIAKQLTTYFVPKYLGVDAISRDVAMTHNTAYTDIFFGHDSVVTIWDGTYFYIQKSADYELARRTYSGQKKRPLIKFMSIVLPDGHVLDTLGPFMSDGKNNDAGMTRYILEFCSGLKEWLEDGDISILDRGFRDVRECFEGLGIESKMPSYLGKGLSQHTADEANQSRLVTKTRWVVESYHARLKKWLFFYNVIDNAHIPYMNDYVRIVSAALNAFRPPLVQPSPDHIKEAEMMLHVASQKKNNLKARVEEGALSSRGGKWQALDAADAVPDFPRLDTDYIRSLTFGTYQIKQAKSYTHEHLDDKGDFYIEVHSSAPDLIRIRIQSRHIGAKKYFLWIQYSNNSNDTDPIQAWYCQCKAGERVVGCCAHVASVIWYLGLTRYDRSLLPRKRNFKTSLMNAAETTTAASKCSKVNDNDVSDLGAE